MVILGDVTVARFSFGQSLFTAKGFAAYRELTDILHLENCLACAGFTRAIPMSRRC